MGREIAESSTDVTALIVAADAPAAPAAAATAATAGGAAAAVTRRSAGVRRRADNCEGWY